MSCQVWLKPNRRVLAWATLIPLTVLGLGVWLGTTATGVLCWLGLILTLGGAAATIGLLVQFARPRLALRDGHLLVFLRLGSPLFLPLSVVECVFLGRPETQLALGQRNRMVSLVIRLAEAQTEYKSRVVKPMLGRWEDGYITIHGAWCEPLTLDLAQQLNSKLRDAQRRQAESLKENP